MRRTAQVLWQTLSKRLLVVGFVGLLSLGSLLTIAIQPSHAQIPLDSKETSLTKEELTGRPYDAPLTSEEKIDRAYTFRQGTGMLEEERQSQAKTPTPNEDNESLLEKAKDAVESVTGDNT